MLALLLAALVLAGAVRSAPAQTAEPPNPDSLAPLMARGVSSGLAAYRARQLRDVRYTLRLDVTARDSAVGRATIHFRKVGPGDVILDWRGLALGDVVVNGRTPADSGDSIIANGAHLRIPERALAMGENSVEMTFVSAIAPAGASIIRYHDATDGADYLYTLLVPADANALFPCFDQPDLKARVSLTLVTPRGWSAVANGALERADSLGADSAAADSTVADAAGPASAHADAITWRFAVTRPLSTYLIAFAAGPWVQFHTAAGTRPITLYVRASRAHEVDADTLLALNARALDWLERYFGRPYPFGKFDFVLAPAFPFGGMEHPGAVFYNEDSFIFRERPTLTQELGRESAIFHEVAHQWFGDLVTMRWFDDLWLKEGFATYMAAKMQAALDPRSNAWKTFYLRIKPPAYAVDASAGTTPVWQELDNLDQAKSNYGAIVYDKAPSILKQLEYLVGERAFQAGLRAFLRQHAYGNATWRDLLHAVGAAAGKKLDDFGEQYILRPGMPVFEQHLEIDDARIARLDLLQHPAQPLSGPGAWPARLLVVLWYADAPLVSVPVTVTSDSTPVPVTGRAAPGFVFANGADYGYGLVMLDDRSVAWLERHIESVDDSFLRAMLWGALWDLVRDARFPPESYVRLVLRALPRERDEQIAAGILGRVVRATNAYLPDSEHRALLPDVEGALARVANDSTRRYGVRKASLDALIGVTATPGGLARLDSMLDGDSAAGAPLRSPTRWAIVTALVAHGARGAARRLADETRRDSTSEGKRRAFVAGAARPSAASKRAYWARWFGDSTLNEEWVMASLRAFNDPSQDSLTLRYVIPALDSLPWIQRNRRIFFLGNWLSALLDGQHREAALEEVDGFLAAHEDWPPDLREKILQAADELRRTVRIREERGTGNRE